MNDVLELVMVYPKLQMLVKCDLIESMDYTKYQKHAIFL